MKNKCISCGAPDPKEITIKNKKYYYCNQCGKINSRFVDTSDNIVAIKDSSNNVKHVVISGVFIHRNKILMIKRRVWPYFYDLPTGHLEYNETIIDAFKREALEETGILVNQADLVFHKEIKDDSCRYGADTHEWYIFRVFVDDQVILPNSEIDKLTWLSLDEIAKLDLLPGPRELFKKFQIDQKKHQLSVFTKYRSDAPSNYLERQKELLFHLSQGLWKIDDLRKTLSSALEESFSCIDGEAMGIFVNPSRGHEISLFKSKKNNKQLKEFCEKNSLFWKTSQHRKTKRIGQFLVMFIPLISNGKNIGVFYTAIKANHFTESQSQFLGILANQLAVAIDNNFLLKKSESERQLLDSVIKNIQDGVLVVDRNNRIIIWNKFLEEITNIKAEQVIGQSGIEIAAKLGLKDLASIVIHTIKNRGRLNNFQLERKIISSTGEPVWISMTLSHIIDSRGQAGNIVVVARNISKEKSLIQAKNEFISTATHELRTPLTSIKGYLSMILHGDAGELSQKQGQYFTRAYLSTERLVHLVEDLLGVLRIEENKISLDLKTSNLSNIVKLISDDFQNKATQKSIKLSYEIEPDILSIVDRSRTQQIIENLIDNAIKYTRNNGSIVVSLKQKDNQAILSVKDSGVGIPTKRLGEVFDRFIRIPNALSVKAGGNGLGLFIAKSLAEKQGGSISVESEYGKGSTFYLSLPLAVK